MRLNDRCPITGSVCNCLCAWYISSRDECAVAIIAREILK